LNPVKDATSARGTGDELGAEARQSSSDDKCRHGCGQWNGDARGRCARRRSASSSERPGQHFDRSQEGHGSEEEGEIEETWTACGWGDSQRQNAMVTLDSTHSATAAQMRHAGR
jgi:hypothetical protein